MYPISSVAEAESSLAMRSSSRQGVPPLPLEMIYEIFSWLTPRYRHQLYQDSSLKKAIAFVDRLDWKPFQKFIGKLSQEVEKIAEEELKDELSSLLTSLIEVEEKDVSFYEREADFFVELFKISPRAFEHLRISFEEGRFFINEVSIYRRFNDTRLHTPTTLQDCVKRDHCFPAYKIFPLLSPRNQASCAIDMITAYWDNTIGEPHLERERIEHYRNGILFFTNKLAEMPCDPGIIRSYSKFSYLKLSLIFFINYGYLENAKDLHQIVSADDKTAESFYKGGGLFGPPPNSPLFYFLLAKGNLGNTREFLRMFPGDNVVRAGFNRVLHFAQTQDFGGERVAAIFEHFIHEDFKEKWRWFRKFLIPIFEDFIKKVSRCVEEVDSALKDELTSLLTNLKELNRNRVILVEKEALFIPLFNLTPPAFDYLSTYLGENHPFIFMEEVSLYRNLVSTIPVFPPPFAIEETFLKWSKEECFFSAKRISSGVLPDYRAPLLANMIYAYWKRAMTETILEEQVRARYRQELTFFVIRLIEIPTIKTADYSKKAQKYALQALIHLGYEEAVKTLNNIFPKNQYVEKMFCEAVEDLIKQYDAEEKEEEIFDLVRKFIPKDREKAIELINRNVSEGRRRDNLIARLCEGLE